ncbi:unnamed protein product, partial [Urochloa humidicola]
SKGYLPTLRAAPVPLLLSSQHTRHAGRSVKRQRHCRGQRPRDAAPRSCRHGRASGKNGGKATWPSKDTSLPLWLRSPPTGPLLSRELLSSCRCRGRLGGRQIGASTSKLHCSAPRSRRPLLRRLVSACFPPAPPPRRPLLRRLLLRRLLVGTRGVAGRGGFPSAPCSASSSRCTPPPPPTCAPPSSISLPSWRTSENLLSGDLLPGKIARLMYSTLFTPI